MSRGKARRWEGAKLARFRKQNRGRNPTYKDEKRRLEVLISEAESSAA